MARLRLILARLAGLFGVGSGRIREELDSHLELLTADYMRDGLDSATARAAARRALGNEMRIEQTWHEQRGVPPIETFVQDIRHGLRTMRKSPGFTAVAIGTLALGVGATTAMFTVVSAVLLEPLPYPHPSQLVVAFDFRRTSLTNTSYPNLETERERNTVFSAMAGVTAHQLTLTGIGEPTIVNTVSVTSDYFPLFAVPPILGRTLLPRDCTRGAATAVLLSEALWRGRFSGDPSVVGRSIELDKRPFTVVGVMPGTFRDPVATLSAQVWIPVFQDPLFGPFTVGRGGELLRVFARLKPGVTLTQAQTEMDAIGTRMAADYPESDANRSIRLEPLQETIVGNIRPVLLVLLGAVGLVLLIACANIANLLLARATVRGTEIGVRFALGAGRGRIIRQLLTESLVLGLMGGTAGVMLAYGAVHLLVTNLPTNVPRVHTITVDGWALTFSLLLSLGVGILFGLAPALLCTGVDLQTYLREGNRSGTDGRRRARNILVVAEVAIATVLVVGAGLLLRTLHALTNVNAGLDVHQVWKVDVSLPQYEYRTPAQWTAFADQLMAGIREEPGLAESAIGVPLPLIQLAVTLPFQIVGRPAKPPGSAPDTAHYVAISLNYFRVMRIPQLAGRPFDDRDSMTALPVTIVSEALARRYFGGTDPIGHDLVFAFSGRPVVARAIVGVVGDLRDVSLEQPAGPMMYVPFDQAPFWGTGVVVRSGLDPTALISGIRRQVQRIDADLPVTDFLSVASEVQATASPARFRTWLFGSFGVAALLLAAAGVFGVLSYSVLRRMREMGIRLALGASPVSLKNMILRETGSLAGTGLMLGLLAALAGTRLLKSELYGVRADDPWTFAVAAAVLACVALIAGYLPARRAMRVDPVRALRSDGG